MRYPVFWRRHAKKPKIITSIIFSAWNMALECEKTGKEMKELYLLCGQVRVLRVSVTELRYYHNQAMLQKYEFDLTYLPKN